MNELVWEGLVDILRGELPPIKAAARLWRRDDSSGTDWGGQIELPVVFRRLVPPGDYLIRLSTGIEGRVRLSQGPSTTALTFPTLVGLGRAPFGSGVAVEAERNAEAEEQEPMSDTEAVAAPVAEAATVPVDAAASAAPVNGASAAPVNGATEVAATEVAAPGDAVALPPASVAAANVDPSPGAVAAPVEVAAPPPAAVEPEPGSGSRPPAFAPAGSLAPARFAETEALARAFLAAVEARQHLERLLDRQGFEGRAVAATLEAVDAIATTVEGALRGRSTGERWPEVAARHEPAIAWFAQLAALDGDADVARTGRALQALGATLASSGGGQEPQAERAA